MRRNELGKEREARDASLLTVGVVVSEFNSDVTEALLDGALEALAEWGVQDENIEILRVPGSFELPYGCVKLLSRGKKDALVALGCIIKGETEHDRHLASAVFPGLMTLSVERDTALGLGVLTTNTLAEAKARASGEENAGRTAAFTALTLALS
ncbi:MAG: 6,7-dimethyl-8-ribityllumazine synthase [Minisyncoccia bacterium]